MDLHIVPNHVGLHSPPSHMDLHSQPSCMALYRLPICPELDSLTICPELHSLPTHITLHTLSSPMALCILMRQRTWMYRQMNGFEDCWYYHGETISAATSSKTCETPVEQIGLQFGDIEEMLHDVFYMHTRSTDDIRDETNEAEPFSQGPSEQRNENAQRFYDLLKDAKQPLYEGCKSFSKLSSIVHLYHLKYLRGLSNETFTMILQALKAMLPPDAKLPKDCYEAKKIIKDLGLGYENIHACPKECGLEMMIRSLIRVLHPKGKEKGAKVLRWLPVKTRLQRLYMALETAESMKWHAEGRTKDVTMRYPANTPVWKSFDSKHKDFATEPCNVRLGIASDSPRFNVADEEERMRNKETIRKLEDKGQAQEVEINNLKEQVAFVMRYMPEITGLQVITVA
ncbi:hypothetical protein RHSIM_Rhsim11G0031600 [Rhododendron simsii]|uniref:Uncharacterized protein n=1 Tax=Rhododendron simsii TaxID=118357 RepID=A0A834G8E6_RHOSS|nr:hypothetical protein RHSIM_Rhsim11G0031600 [Rhododendron simsii]